MEVSAVGPMPEGLCLNESSLHLELKSEASGPDELARKLVPGKKKSFSKETPYHLR